MNIAGIPRAKVLVALYNRAQAQGMGWLQYDPTPMTEEEATRLLLTYRYFDYLKGRVMKVDLSSDEVETALYNRDNGPSAAEDAIDAIRPATGEKEEPHA